MHCVVLFPSAELALAAYGRELENLSRRAERPGGKVVGRGPKTDRAGKQVGERAEVLVRTSESIQYPYGNVVWTNGKMLCLVNVYLHGGPSKPTHVAFEQGLPY